MRTMQQAAAARPLGGGAMLQRNRTPLILQREASAHAAATAQPGLIQGVLNSPGRPLDSSTRDFMEPQLGHDLSGVRVHTDDAASQAAQSVNANAFTAGNHIVFGSGRYTPGTQSGRHMLAHELTHVAQQARGPVSGTPVGDGFSVSDPQDSFERDASRTADAISASSSDGPHRASSLAPLPAPQTTGSASLQRDLSTGDKWAIAGGIAGIVGAVAAIVGIGFAIAAWRRPANPAPTTGGVNFTPNPFQFDTKTAPVIEPNTPAARASSAAAAQAEPHKHKIIELNTDSSNHAEFNLALRSDGYNILSAGIEQAPSRGYAGGTGGSTAQVNFAQSQTVPAAGAGMFATDPAAAPATAAPATAAPATAAPATAAPATAATPAAAAPAAAAPATAAATPAATPAHDIAEVVLSFGGINNEGQSAPQAFAGEIVVRANDTVNCRRCVATNGIGSAHTHGEYGVIDYRGTSAAAAPPAQAPAATPAAAPPAAPATPPASNNTPAPATPAPAPAPAPVPAPAPAPKAAEPGDYPSPRRDKQYA